MRHQLEQNKLMYRSTLALPFALNNLRDSNTIVRERPKLDVDWIVLGRPYNLKYIYIYIYITIVTPLTTMIFVSNYGSLPLC